MAKQVNRADLVPIHETLLSAGSSLAEASASLAAAAVPALGLPPSGSTIDVATLANPVSPASLRAADALSKHSATIARSVPMVANAAPMVAPMLGGSG